MKVSLPFLPLLFLTLIFFIQANAQQPSARRIRTADLSSETNLPFMRQGAEIGRILTDAVKEGLLAVFFFEDFNGTPAELTKNQFLQNLELPSYYEAWDATYDYFDSETITYNGEIYTSLPVDMNLGNPPDQSPDFWAKAEKFYYHPASLAQLDLDEQLIDGEWHVQYLHLSIPADPITEETLYVGSFRADAALAALNASGFVWYEQVYNEPNRLAPMGHIVGDIYLSNYDYPALESLKQNGYTLSATVLDLMAISNYPNENTQAIVKYGTTGIDSVFIAKTNTQEIIDSVDFVSMSDEHHPMMRLGDALTQNAISTAKQERELTVLEDADKVNSKNRLKRKITTTLRERVDFSLSGNAAFSQAMGLMTDDIIQATQSGFITLFEQVSLTDKPMVSTKIEQPFVAQQVELYVEDPEYYEPDYAYNRYQTVSFEGVAYVSQKDQNKGNLPSVSPKDWQALEPAKAYYTPDVIKIMDIDYQLIFKTNGKVKQKKVKSIAFLVPGKYAADGINDNLGYADYNQLNSFAKKNKKPWHTLLRDIAEQNVLRFQMLDYTPLREHKP